MRKILASSVSLFAIAAAVFYGTTAFFSDTEASVDNTFTAGQIDLQIDSTGRYNGMVCTDVGDDTYQWIPENEVASESFDAAAWNVQNPAAYPQAGTACDVSWNWTSLVDGQKFFNYPDIKPEDAGSSSISMHVINNDAWACMELEATTNTQNMGDALMFYAWMDTNNNGVQDEDEVAITANPVPASSLFGPAGSPIRYALADSNPSSPNGGVPFVGSDDPELATQYVGMMWCAGSLTLVDGAPVCDGTLMDDTYQGGSFLADVSFDVVQSRNNEDFLCTEGEVGGVTTETGTGFGPLTFVDPAESSTAWTAIARYGNNQVEAGDFETALKTAPSSNVAVAGRTWTSNDPQSFTLSVDAGGNATWTVGGTVTNFAMPAVKTDGRVVLVAKAPKLKNDSGLGVVTVSDLTVAGESVAETLVATGTTGADDKQYLMVDGADLTGPFTITGTLKFEFGNSSNTNLSQERPALDLMIEKL